MPLQDVPFYDKWAHFVMYGVLSLTIQFECQYRQLQRRSLSWWLLCGAFPCLWGVLMELAQATLTTYRSGDVLDALANVMGVVIGLVVGLAVCVFSSCRTRGRS